MPLTKRRKSRKRTRKKKGGQMYLKVETLDKFEDSRAKYRLKEDIIGIKDAHGVIDMFTTKVEEALRNINDPKAFKRATGVDINHQPTEKDYKEVMVEVNATRDEIKKSIKEWEEAKLAGKEKEGDYVKKCKVNSLYKECEYKGHKTDRFCYATWQNEDNFYVCPGPTYIPWYHKINMAHKYRKYKRDQAETMADRIEAEKEIYNGMLEDVKPYKTALAKVQGLQPLLHTAQLNLAIEIKNKKEHIKNAWKHSAKAARFQANKGTQDKGTPLDLKTLQETWGLALPVPSMKEVKEKKMTEVKFEPTLKTLQEVIPGNEKLYKAFKKAMETTKRPGISLFVDILFKIEEKTGFLEGLYNSNEKEGLRNKLKHEKADANNKYSLRQEFATRMINAVKHFYGDAIPATDLWAKEVNASRIAGGDQKHIYLSNKLIHLMLAASKIPRDQRKKSSDEAVKSARSGKGGRKTRRRKKRKRKRTKKKRKRRRKRTKKKRR